MTESRWAKVTINLKYLAALSYLGDLDKLYSESSCAFPVYTRRCLYNSDRRLQNLPSTDTQTAHHQMGCISRSGYSHSLKENKQERLHVRWTIFPKTHWPAVIKTVSFQVLKVYSSKCLVKNLSAWLHILMFMNVLVFVSWFFIRKSFSFWGYVQTAGRSFSLSRAQRENSCLLIYD